MANVTIDQAALARIQKKLGTFKRFAEEAKAPMAETLELIKDSLKEYPQKNANAFSQLATDKQRRAYWARVRAGEITHRDGVGYVRSGSLGRKWNSENKRVSGGRRGIIGNNSNYARFVQGSEWQQPFHGKSKWVTNKLALRRTESAREKIWSAWIKRQLNR